MVLTCDHRAKTFFATRVTAATRRDFSRGELEDRLYGWGDGVQNNVVEFLIHALRKKLGSDAIKNVRQSDG